MTDSDKMEEVKKLIFTLINMSETEEEEDMLFEKISLLSPDPEWSNYVFHSDEFYMDDENLDVGAVVEKIFQYKPIIL